VRFWPLSCPNSRPGDWPSSKPKQQAKPGRRRGSGGGDLCPAHRFLRDLCPAHRFLRDLCPVHRFDAEKKWIKKQVDQEATVVASRYA